MKSVFFILAFGGFVSIFCNNLFAQKNADFQSLIYPRSLASVGLGEQGVCLKDGISAMQYNPANLVYTDNFTISYFRNPLNIFGFGGYTISSICLAMNFGANGSFGIEYTDWDFGEVYYLTSLSPDSWKKSHFYESSLACGYAISLNNNIAVGTQIRYIWKPIFNSEDIEHLIFSAGLIYYPEIFSDKIAIGLSLMNFGTPIAYKIKSALSNEERTEHIPVPAQLNLGIKAIAVENKFFNINLSLGAKKPFDKISDYTNYVAQSSFKSLFNDWDDFPNDMTVQAGLGYLWHPIYLGSGISFIQEMYLGYFSTGPKDSYSSHDSFYTHGLKIGLAGYGIQLMAGYAGRWHNNNTGSYYWPWVFPWETFQFVLNVNTDLLLNKSSENVQKSTPNGIILSGGCNYGVIFGKFKGRTINGIKSSTSITPIWLVEADFYIDDKSAIFTLLDYSRLTYKYRMISLPLSMNFGIETFSLESGFRYHPLEIFEPFFIQLSLGVIRMNPVYERTQPRYFYQSYSRIVFGGVIPVFDSGIVVMPKVGLRTIFMGEYTNPSRLGGYNQYELGLNIGYKL